MNRSSIKLQEELENLRKKEAHSSAPPVDPSEVNKRLYVLYNMLDRIRNGANH